MIPEVDLVEVGKLCLALLMLAFTIGVCALVAGMVRAGLKGRDED